MATPIKTQAKPKGLSKVMSRVNISKSGASIAKNH
jgi:hypothetical protein